MSDTVITPSFNMSRSIPIAERKNAIKFSKIQYLWHLILHKTIQTEGACNWSVRELEVMTFESMIDSILTFELPIFSNIKNQSYACSACRDVINEILPHFK